MNDRPAVQTERTTAYRYPERVTYDRADAYAILDEALHVHVGFATEEGPFVIPSLHAREGDRLILHGSAHGRFVKTVSSGAPVCVTATIIDGLILGRAASHHSAAYRSVMVFGTATPVEDAAERAEALARVVENVVPGRLSGANAARRPSVEEAEYTAIMTMPISEFSIKVRAGFARDEPKDDEVAAWAGTIPLTTTPGAAVPDAITGTRFSAPAYDPTIHRFRQD
ncbi:pyridoxamine 5'-phosphate oxidase family protein [Streptomyces sp. NBC_01264]|uniref:pyridoxamine 5'-phosphate oxidase family protein n=1 Tax=Streptomyces sp. NBC_01264 TaxID=2903804 RepID=UPI0022540A18|nr:pyridoxamine 5'-phosphate oxidase family protein [Streptomyces sp. NBC_01264]MCX4775528.1 pyridoxamine 5'-phosphate oxidase family protein [Streptomyces sp. NBC_01264]